MEAELGRLRRMTEEQRQVDQARRQLEDMLEIKCPRCANVLSFDAFDGCMAARCPHAGCGAGFCAWCLHDCGDDAHGHVVNCPDKVPGADVFYDTSCVLGPDVLCDCRDENGADQKCRVAGKQVHRRRQAAAVTEHLRGLGDRVRAEVIRASRGLLEHSDLESVLDHFDDRGL